MIVCLSERILANRIKQFENLDSAVTGEELFATPQYFERFRNHLYNGYSLEIETGTCQINGQLGLFRVKLHTSDFDQIAEGLALLEPLNVSLEVTDLPNLHAPLLVDSWHLIANRLQRLSLPLVNVIDALEKVSWELHNSAKENLPGLEEVGFDEWSVRQGLPLNNTEKLKEARKLQEEMARRKSNENRIAHREEDDRRIWIRELPRQ